MIRVARPQQRQRRQLMRVSPMRPFKILVTIMRLSGLSSVFAGATGRRPEDRALLGFRFRPKLACGS